MKIRIYSDLHLEFDAMKLPEGDDVDVLILSGDIVLSDHIQRLQLYNAKEIAHDKRATAIANKGRRYLEFIEDASAKYKHVVYIMGNHEHYQGYYDRSKDIIQDAVAHLDNFHFLDNSKVEIDGVNFLGTTLWTDIGKSNPGAIMQASMYMNDYACIRVAGEGHRKLDALDTIRAHETAMDFLANGIRKDMTNVVVGHHAPSHMSIHERYRNGDDVMMNYSYYSDLSEFILDNPEIALWTHGHCHNNSDYMIGDTRVVCNPKGYEQENAREFQPNIVVEI